MSDLDRAAMAFQLLQQVNVLLTATYGKVYKTALDSAHEASAELFRLGVNEVSK